MTNTALSLDFRKSFCSEILAQTEEPTWSQSLRQKAWDSYQNLPEPLPPQRNLRRIPLLDESNLKAPGSSPAGAGLDERQASWGNLASTAQMLNATALEVSLSERLKAQGVVLCSLQEALLAYPEKVQTALDQVLPATENREAALNLSYWRNGFFLWVPRGVEIQEPLYLLSSLNQAQQALFSRSLILLDEGAQATVICDYHAESQGQPSFSSDLIEMVLGSAAHLKLIHLQNWGQEVHAHSYTQAKLERDAHLTQMNLSLGAAFHYAQTQSLLQAKGAESLFLGLNMGQAQQHFRQHTLQDHRSPHTRSELIYHSVLKDEAYSFFNGMIYVSPEAQQSESGQVSKSLLLSDKSRADAIPNLEILADDVQSGHGAAIGSLDPEQRFYLMSRGFDQHTAESLLVEGFMEEVILRFPHEDLQQRIAAHLSLHLLAEGEDRSEA
ncbi:Fe-S cluster assembly protein SufD [bacterium (Candidatus Blackallbacteria) CG17_big_fil_post_rev_8_21_14_2_50_48_46]|uniref:Fe-S cluster assembly protein SufD n=1 Tax=bacterium (Candidatus Blackallbacteria) CG17_big_fil_post_rev_8_21_14_2_50_48_46 TaxID=2014261 RepID=A0A2M7G2F4_9BACT|nr:MAG: Fe-S cluster assembly protein SufD [bacterium (Candidatus Blackallbacteria) CG18_big_fil_WC_8_21_14_2_50_49_26]PIW15980.1 MAG: Fe-S cluster assembly protein SufD [bacterium (Candidatus Blackallbacteria) CG17_big_fil_post_rev_8_21_14_2_50_48_46]PIW50392.1 MAG: Fe-S cluster assembly protein SufD [bacterium (Candidatus Blackallbacteria) CG13_big_fil_rev_8_21_14_2_50_49_14]